MQAAFTLELSNLPGHYRERWGGDQRKVSRTVTGKRDKSTLFTTGVLVSQRNTVARKMTVTEQTGQVRNHIALYKQYATET